MDLDIYHIYRIMYCNYGRIRPWDSLNREKFKDVLNEIDNIQEKHTWINHYNYDEKKSYPKVLYCPDFMSDDYKFGSHWGSCSFWSSLFVKNKSYYTMWNSIDNWNIEIKNRDPIAEDYKRIKRSISGSEHNSTNDLSTKNDWY